MPSDDRKYFPLIAGLRLFYRGRAPGEEDSTSSFEVIEINGVWPAINARCRNSWQQGMQRGSDEFTIRARETGISQSHRTLLPFPLETGRSWDDGSEKCTIQSKNETVSVPAGVFTNCLRATYPIHGGDAGWGEKIYAPGLGLIREVHSDEASPWERVLVRYDIETEFYSCFISYSSKDEGFVRRLYDDLQAEGVPCWLASHDIQGGQKIYEQIDQAIRTHDRLLVILSHDSMNSEWVKTEIAKARKREIQEQRRVLFPVRLVSFDVLSNWELFDADTGKDSAREIREYFIPDFSNWTDSSSYDDALQRLLRDLRAQKSIDENRIIGALLRLKEHTHFLWNALVSHADDRSNFNAKIKSGTLRSVESDLQLLADETGLRFTTTEGVVDVDSGEPIYEIAVTDTTHVFWKFVDKVIAIDKA